MTMQIHSVVCSGDMGEGWTDDIRAAHGYAAFLRAELEGEFPGAEITVEVREHTAGERVKYPISYTDGRVVEDDEYERLGNAENVAWEDFCRRAPAELFA